jgi:hypothetical protein
MNASVYGHMSVMYERSINAIYCIPIEKHNKQFD